MAVRVDRAIGELSAGPGRSPSVESLAQYLNVSVEDALGGLEASAAHYSASLDAPARGDDVSETVVLGEVLGADDERLGLVELSASLSAAIDCLAPSERRALGLRLRYDMKQGDIATVMGCSQMHVSRLLRRATTTLRTLTAHDDRNGPD